MNKRNLGGKKFWTSLVIAFIKEEQREKIFTPEFGTLSAHKPKVFCRESMAAISAIVRKRRKFKKVW